MFNDFNLSQKTTRNNVFLKHLKILDQVPHGRFQFSTKNMKNMWHIQGLTCPPKVK